jgi:uncharacterized membrane protein
MSIDIGYAIFAVTVMGCFAATMPTEMAKPWLRAAILTVSITAVIWLPWAWRLAQWNYECAFPVAPPVEANK